MTRYLVSIRYFQIKVEGGRSGEFIAPAILSLVICSVLFAFFPMTGIFGEKGFIDRFSGLLSALVGFFIAALAAVATFQGHANSMDEPMPGKSATLVTVIRGEPTKKQISRRRYLSLLFGHLATTSFILLITTFVFMMSFQIKSDLGNNIICAINFAALFFYVYVLTHLAVGTAIGIYYLSERIHEVNAKVIQDASVDED